MRVTFHGRHLRPGKKSVPLSGICVYNENVPLVELMQTTLFFLCGKIATRHLLPALWAHSSNARKQCIEGGNSILVHPPTGMARRWMGYPEPDEHQLQEVPRISPQAVAAVLQAEGHTQSMLLIDVRRADLTVSTTN